MIPRTKATLLWAAGFLLIAVVAAVFFLDDMRDQLLPLFEWMEKLGPEAILWFILIYVALVVFLVPSLPMTLAGGFLFGLVLGSIYVIAAAMVGAAIAFVIARYFLHETASRALMKHPALERINRGIGREGWKIVMLCRFIPFFPAKLSNYFFGLTRVRLRDFLIGNLIGVLPLTLLNVYIGSLAGNLATLGERESQSPLEWILYGLGLAAAIFVVAYVTRLARGEMEKTLAREEEHGDRPPR